MPDESSRALTLLAARSLERLLDSPELPAIVPALEPRTLHQLVQVQGLEDAAPLLAHATPQQLAQVFDLDLWQAGASGRGDRFDATRFGTWIEVLVEQGVDQALAFLRKLEPTFAAVALSQHIAVAGRQVANARGLLATGESIEIAGVTLIARHDRSFDAIVALLAELAVVDQARFRDLMVACRHLSYEHLEEASGFDNLLTRREQALEDLAFARAQRREAAGHVSRAEATAFLVEARRVNRRSAAPSDEFLSRSYFRDQLLEAASTQAGASDADASPSAPFAPSEDVRADVALLVAALAGSVVPLGPVRGLLPESAAPSAVPCPVLADFLQAQHEAGPASHARVLQELSFLANVLLEGGVIHDRRFTEAEAFEASQAVCNLGLEGWPSAWAARTPTLVAAFQVGWTILHEEVCVATARALVAVLGQLSRGRSAMLDDLRMLRRALMAAVDAGEPWRVRPRLDAVAILDAPTWGTLLHLLNQCPVVPHDWNERASARGGRGPLRQTDAFAFITDRRGVEWTQVFASELLARLS